MTERLLTDRTAEFEQLVADMSLDDMRTLQIVLSRAIKTGRSEQDEYDIYDNGVNP